MKDKGSFIINKNLNFATNILLVHTLPYLGQKG